MVKKKEKGRQKEIAREIECFDQNEGTGTAQV